MGFDNECILNIQSLPGEYFCPVCRTLIYPNEALQTQCTHLYCKPCLAYTVATTQACPYDGYLVTEADSKPLMESNKSLADTIGKVTVHCLYHKSGCQWQGKLSDCITHGTTCAYGNSPVVCNRCAAQIVHRQVQEHAQLCPGLQPQTQQSDSSLTQSSAATTQAVSQDPSAVASAAPAAAATAAPATTVPSTTTARTVTAFAVATSSAVATTTSTMAVPPFLAAAPAASQGQAVAPQTPTAEQYQQYYQQHYPGYNPYMQQYQQYGQYQQYMQPQMQVAPQNVAQAPAQPVPYVQPQVLQASQPQHVLPSQPQNQPNLPQLQAPVVQQQLQQNPQLQSAPQISQMQAQSQVPHQLPRPQAQPMAHQPAPAQVGSQPFAMPAAQATPPQMQPNVQTHPPQHQQVVAQQQHPQLQHLPQQQHLQPQIQLSSQIQPHHPQVQRHSYPQPHTYHQPHPMPHAQPQNPSVHAVMGHQSYPQPQPAHQMPQGAALPRPVHVSHQQVVGPQYPALVCPPQGQLPLQGQQLVMLAPQGTQHTQQHQQHVGHHTQRPPMQPSIPSQAPPQGFPLNRIVPSQTGQSYQQGMPSSQQQMHSQPFQPHGPPYVQQHHVQTSAGRSMSYVAPPQQFQNQPSGPLKDLHGAGQPTGQGSSVLESHASESGKSENATNATGTTEVRDNKNGGIESIVIKPTMSQSLSDKNVNREQNDFGNVRKDVAQTSVALDGADNVKGKGEFAGWEINLHGSDVRGDKESKASDTSNDLEKGVSLQQSQQNPGALGSYVPPGMGPQHPSGPDRMLPQHMLHPGSMPYMQGQPNQMRPPKHNFPENNRPPMQQPSYDSYNSEMAPRVLAPNQNQMPIPQPATIRPNDGMIRPPMGGPLPGQHDTAVPPFAPEHVGRPHPLGMAKSNGVGGGQLGTSRAFHEEGFNSSREQFRPFVAYPGRHNASRKDIDENMKQFPRPTHLDGEGLQRGPGLFEGGMGRPDGFDDSLPGRPPFPNQPEFGHHRIDGMPTLRNPGPFFQGMTGGPGGLRKDQLGSGNLPGIVQHGFDSPEFHTRLHPGDTFVPRNLHGGGEPLGHGQLHGIEPSGYHYHGHMHPDDPNLDYSQHGFPKESGHFGSGGHNGDVGWCRICKFNCGSAEHLDLHVQTREHQQYAMDIVLKMKHDVAKRQKMNSGGPKSFNKKVGGKGNFRGNRR